MTRKQAIERSKIESVGNTKVVPVKTFVWKYNLLTERYVKKPTWCLMLEKSEKIT